MQDGTADLALVLVGPAHATALPIQRHQAIAGIADEDRIFRHQRIGTRLIRAESINPLQAQSTDIRSRDRGALSRLEARAAVVDAPSVRIKFRQTSGGFGTDG